MSNDLKHILDLFKLAKDAMSIIQDITMTPEKAESLLYEKVYFGEIRYVLDQCNEDNGKLQSIEKDDFYSEAKSLLFIDQFYKRFSLFHRSKILNLLNVKFRRRLALKEFALASALQEQKELVKKWQKKLDDALSKGRDRDSNYGSLLIDVSHVYEGVYIDKLWKLYTEKRSDFL